jgi:acetylornithine/succinyldiaminopimelate/putrescine aminotransferase
VTTTYRDYLRKAVANREPFMIMPVKTFSRTLPALAHVLAGLARPAAPKARRYFIPGSSALEGISASIKTARFWHTHRKRARPGIAVLDPSNLVADLWHPLRGRVEADTPPLVGGLTLCDGWDDLAAALAHAETGIAVVRPGPGDIARVEALVGRHCRAQDAKTRALLAVDWSALPLDAGAIDALRIDADIHVVGDSFAQYEVPFGGALVRDTFFRPWLGLHGCGLHSSTWAGNDLVCGFVLRTLEESGLVDPALLAHARRVQSDFDAQREAFRQHVSPALLQLARLTGADFCVDAAAGSKLEGSDGRTYIDLGGASGAAIRGHNPHTRDDLTARYAPSATSWDRLEETLHRLTGLPVALPAVSGATAVEAALTTALLAAYPRTKIVTFAANFSGKTIVSLACTRFGELQNPFGPLYEDVIEIDAFAPDAVSTLERELSSGTVALVWMELLQGSTARWLPPEIITAIARHRAEGKYLVGVDEVLTGVHRTGPFLASSRAQVEPDLVTLSKALGDMTCPVACALVTTEVYEAARRASAPTMDHLRSLYRKPLGAEVAVSVLEWTVSSNLEATVAARAERLRAGLERLATTCPLLRVGVSDGLFVCLDIDPKQVDEVALLRALSDAGGLAIGPRLLLPLACTEEDVDRVLAILEQALRGRTKMGMPKRALVQPLLYQARWKLGFG